MSDVLFAAKICGVFMIAALIDTAIADASVRILLASWGCFIALTIIAFTAVEFGFLVWGKVTKRWRR